MVYVSKPHIPPTKYLSKILYLWTNFLRILWIFFKSGDWAISRKLTRQKEPRDWEEEAGREWVGGGEVEGVCVCVGGGGGGRWGGGE